MKSGLDIIEFFHVIQLDIYINRNIKILLTLVWFQFLSNLSRIAFLVGKHRSSKEARFIVDSFAQKTCMCVLYYENDLS